MSKFVFIANNDYNQQDAVLQTSYSDCARKFDVIVENDFCTYDKQLSDSQIIVNECIQQCTVQSIPRQILTECRATHSIDIIAKSAMCISSAINFEGVIDYTFRSVESDFNTRLIMDSITSKHCQQVDSSDIYIKNSLAVLADRISLHENQSFVNLLNAQRPRQMIVDDYGFFLSLTRDSIIICHPAMCSVIVSMNNIDCSQLISCNLLAQNECYIYSQDPESVLGCICFFDGNLQHTVSAVNDYSKQVIVSVVHNFNIAISNNFTKYRFF